MKHKCTTLLAPAEFALVWEVLIYLPSATCYRMHSSRSKSLPLLQYAWVNQRVQFFSLPQEKWFSQDASRYSTAFLQAKLWQICCGRGFQELCLLSMSSRYKTLWATHMCLYNPMKCSIFHAFTKILIFFARISQICFRV